MKESKLYSQCFASHPFLPRPTVLNVLLHNLSPHFHCNTANRSILLSTGYHSTLFSTSLLHFPTQNTSPFPFSFSPPSTSQFSLHTSTNTISPSMPHRPTPLHLHRLHTMRRHLHRRRLAISLMRIRLRRIMPLALHTTIMVRRLPSLRPPRIRITIQLAGPVLGTFPSHKEEYNTSDQGKA